MFERSFSQGDCFLIFKIQYAVLWTQSVSQLLMLQAHLPSLLLLVVVSQFLFWRSSQWLLSLWNCHVSSSILPWSRECDLVTSVWPFSLSFLGSVKHRKCLSWTHPVSAQGLCCGLVPAIWAAPFWGMLWCHFPPLILLTAPCFYYKIILGLFWPKCLRKKNPNW